VVKDFVLERQCRFGGGESDILALVVGREDREMGLIEGLGSV